ncbi:MAG: GDSL-type esterase/lipase family protein [Lachnospiraceae bacterium]|nr:GDSL-type esterase/lipase family protein [Lachnospiraceae bacterium]
MKKVLWIAVLGIFISIFGMKSGNILAADFKAEENWVGAWSTSPVQFNLKKILDLGDIKCEPGLHNLTFRTKLQPTISGEDLRVTLTNEFGTGPMTVDAMTVARGYEKSSEYKLRTKKNVTFDGQKSVTIAPGETVTSDPIGMQVSALEYLVFSSYMKNTNTMKTYGLIGGDTYISTGNYTNVSLPAGVPMRMEGDFGEYSVIPLITNLEVYHPGASSTVIIGDSTLANDIPILLSQRLQDNNITNKGILQQAIKGNRLLDKGAGKLGMIYGESMMDRFERDAINQPGVDTILLKVGVNDIVHPNCKSMKGDAKVVSAEEMIEGYRTLIEMAHMRGIRIFLFTRTPWKGYTRNILGTGDDIQWTPELDAMRQELNAWIRSDDNPADGVIDLDFLCADEECTEMISEYTTDGAHFTKSGQKAVTDAIPLNGIFR